MLKLGYRQEFGKTNTKDTLAVTCDLCDDQILVDTGNKLVVCSGRHIAVEGSEIEFKVWSQVPMDESYHITLLHAESA